MKRKDGDKTIVEILKTIDKLADNPDELSYWTSAVESTAKKMCEDKSENIVFAYCPDEKAMSFFLKDNRCRDCLVKSVELHLPLIPESLQGFFTVFKYNLKNAKFDTDNI